MPPTKSGRYSRPPARDRLLAVANDLFYADGIGAIGVDTLSAEADAAKTTLYSHFGNKDGLVGAYLEDRAARWRHHLREELERRGGSPEEQLLAVFDVLGDWYADPGFRGCPFINAAAELTDREHPGFAAATEHRDWLLELFESLIRKARIKNPRSLARQVLMIYDAATVTAHLDADPEAAQVAKDMLRAVLDRAPRR
jgi:AcrR family transcriptional regulator